MPHRPKSLFSEFLIFLVESQKDYHIKRELLFSSPPPTIPTTKMTTVEMKTTTTAFTIAQMTYMAYTEASYQTRETINTEIVEVPIQPSINTTTMTITTSMPSKTTQLKTKPVSQDSFLEFCVFQRPQQSNQYIQEGKTKRVRGLSGVKELGLICLGFRCITKMRLSVPKFATVLKESRWCVIQFVSTGSLAKQSLHSTTTLLLLTKLSEEGAYVTPGGSFA